MHTKFGFILSLLLASIVAISLSTLDVSRAEEVLKGGDYSFDMGIGYHHANVNGYRKGG